MKNSKIKILFLSAFCFLLFSFSSFSVMAQDTLAVKYQGNTIYKQAVNAIDSITFKLPPVLQTYVVTFHANGGTGTMEPQIFTEGVWQNLTENSFTRDGYLFSGWNTNANGTGTPVGNQQYMLVTQNFNLYAQWIEEGSLGVPCPGMATITDIDGNVYNTVQIGPQCWMRENLKTTHYRTGTPITNIPNPTEWSQTYNNGENPVPAMCYYNNDPESAVTHGGLYNWFAVNTGVLCPTGWHVPSDDEWIALIDYLIANGYNWDGSTNMTENKVAKAMVSVAPYDKGVWLNSGAAGAPGTVSDAGEHKRNITGFSAIPVGERTVLGIYEAYTWWTQFWSSTQNQERNAWRYAFHYAFEGPWRGFMLFENGYSVRCIKN
ncbi:MAG: InlB B-repeat-containing protein [Bacteroidetes bacterium]|nr:InlB B-repeat-containing protein [Bacteroidota bacterium]MCL2301819.1 InlB B-repeat-containing protein [Lentimicrobiaceae bacterium]